MKLCPHWWGAWIVRGHGGYEKRWCRLCRDWEMRGVIGEEAELPHGTETVQSITGGEETCQPRET